MFQTFVFVRHMIKNYDSFVHWQKKNHLCWISNELNSENPIFFSLISNQIKLLRKKRRISEQIIAKGRVIPFSEIIALKMLKQFNCFIYVLLSLTNSLFVLTKTHYLNWERRKREEGERKKEKQKKKETEKEREVIKNTSKNSGTRSPKIFVFHPNVCKWFRCLRSVSVKSVVITIFFSSSPSNEYGVYPCHRIF